MWRNDTSKFSHSLQSFQRIQVMDTHSHSARVPMPVQTLFQFYLQNHKYFMDVRWKLI
ncbi:hypothetical protein MSAN_01326600 [Mycena sanguinolenta]|uniref:Uncharacterized protein n=1 Tax=Mycena sanguinolenta TaxID=230812 RepID=A0A8H7D362_9AGAR|nr:hypothetical protein MSAN_01326600 [Mycena sanguinolenta]